MGIDVEATVIDTHPPLAPHAFIHVGPDKFLECLSMNTYQPFSAMMTRRHRSEAWFPDYPYKLTWNAVIEFSTKAGLGSRARSA
jgi:hypothetical protein